MPAVEPRKLDRNKPFAEIYGDVANNARYEQAGLYFDAGGKEVKQLAEVEMEQDIVAEQAAKAEAKRMDEAIAAGVAARLKELGISPK